MFKGSTFKGSEVKEQEKQIRCGLEGQRRAAGNQRPEAGRTLER